MGGRRMSEMKDVTTVVKAAATLGGKGGLAGVFEGCVVGWQVVGFGAGGMG